MFEVPESARLSVIADVLLVCSKIGMLSWKSREDLFNICVNLHCAGRLEDKHEKAAPLISWWLDEADREEENARSPDFALERARELFGNLKYVFS